MNNGYRIGYYSLLISTCSLKYNYLLTMNLLKSILAGFFGLMLLTGSVSGQTQQPGGFNFVVFGDMPYTLPADYLRFENLIRDVNAQKSQVFNVHVGDIKASKEECTDEAYRKMFAYFAQFEKPLIYTPGDNEWTDCNKYHNPPVWDEEERLNALRKLFFNGKTSLGKTTLPLVCQANNSKFATYVENNRWEHSTISFATVHVVGSNNNFYPNARNNNAEFYGRDAADRAWLDEVFDNAVAKNHAGVVLFLHADMFNPDKDSREANAFADFKDKLTERVKAFKKPVLLVNGDSHVFIVDKPLYEKGKLKKDIDNFTRLQVFGENNMHAVRVFIDPSAPGLFRIEQLMIAGN
jgi:hypothetical protein